MNEPSFDPGIDPEIEELLTTAQASKLMQVHISTIHRWVEDGRLPGWRRAGRMVVLKADVLAMLQPIVPKKDRPKPPPTDRQRQKQSAWTRKILEEAGIAR